MKTCSAHLGSEKEMQSLSQEPWQNQFGFSMQRKSASHREMGMGEAGCQISVFNKMLCKIPQETEKISLSH